MRLVVRCLLLCVALALFRISGAEEPFQASPPVTEQTPEATASNPPLSNTPSEIIPTDASDAYTATDSYENSFLKMLAALGLLLLLLAISFWSFRRLSRGRYGTWGGGGSLKILEKKALSPKSMLYVVEYQGRKMLIAESQCEIRSLIQLEETQNL